MITPWLNAIYLHWFLYSSHSVSTNNSSIWMFWLNWIAYIPLEIEGEHDPLFFSWSWLFLHDHQPTTPPKLRLAWFKSSSQFMKYIKNHNKYKAYHILYDPKYSLNLIIHLAQNVSKSLKSSMSTYTLFIFEWRIDLKIWKDGSLESTNWWPIRRHS